MHHVVPVIDHVPVPGNTDQAAREPADPRRLALGPRVDAAVEGVAQLGEHLCGPPVCPRPRAVPPFVEQRRLPPRFADLGPALVHPAVRANFVSAPGDGPRRLRVVQPVAALHEERGRDAELGEKIQHRRQRAQDRLVQIEADRLAGADPKRIARVGDGDAQGCHWPPPHRLGATRRWDKVTVERQAESVMPDNTDRAALLSRMFAALDRGDVEAYLAVLTEDASRVSATTVRVVGRPAIRNSLAAFSTRSAGCATIRSPPGREIAAPRSRPT
jgi:hypothetical protein